MLDFTQIFDGTPPNTGASVTTTRVSTNTIDLLTGRDIGAGNPLAIRVHILEAFATCTSLVVDYEVSADNITFFNILSSPVVPVAQLIVGCPIFRYPVPLNQVLNATAGVLKVPGRYVRLQYTIAGSAATTGKVMAYLTPIGDRNQYYSYPENYTVNVTAAEL